MSCDLWWILTAFKCLNIMHGKKPKIDFGKKILSCANRVDCDVAFIELNE